MNSTIEVRAERSRRDRIPSRYTRRRCTGFRNGGVRGGLKALQNLASLKALRKVRACVVSCRVRRDLSRRLPTIGIEASHLAASMRQPTSPGVCVGREAFNESVGGDEDVDGR